jgi:hypothetical protein
MLGQAARTFLLNGAAWISVWGPDCERFHDIIDEEHVALRLDDPERMDIVTTWHTDESLDEALQFFVDAAHWPKHSALEWLAVAVARADWYEQIRTHLKCG